MNTPCVYQLTFPNGKAYIGISVNFAQRMTSHRRITIRRNTALGAALRKYGFDNVKREVLLHGSIEYIKLMERRIIEGFRTMAPHGYNLTPGGDGVEHTQVMRDAQAARRHADWARPEYRAKIIASSLGRKMTPEQNARNAETKRHHWADPTYRAKTTAAHMGAKQSDATIAKRVEKLKASWKSGPRRESCRAAMTGRQWANNGVDHRQLRQGEPIPVGWVRGMLKRKA